MISFINISTLMENSSDYTKGCKRILKCEAVLVLGSKVFLNKPTININ